MILLERRVLEHLVERLYLQRERTGHTGCYHKHLIAALFRHKVYAIVILRASVYQLTILLVDAHRHFAPAGRKCSNGFGEPVAGTGYKGTGQFKTCHHSRCGHTVIVKSTAQPVYDNPVFTVAETIVDTSD